jgi:hypothetical protein
MACSRQLRILNGIIDQHGNPKVRVPDASRAAARAALASALVLLCTGCRVTSERLIVGTYRAEAPCETITLVVNRDYSFVQSVRTHTGEINRLSGKWSSDKYGVTFKPFLDFLDNGQGSQRAFAGFLPEVMPRGITMGPIIVKCPDSDHEIDYVK